MTIEACAKRFSTVYGMPRENSQPTTASIEVIERTLGFKIPADFIHFTRLCPNYTSWFASLGENFEDPLHILKLHAEYHSDHIMLPPELIVINHGYDGDLSCYDLSRTDSSGRYSIVYCWVPESEVPGAAVSDRRHEAFSICEYLEPHLTFWERIRH
jgi:hypothetical protein